MNYKKCSTFLLKTFLLFFTQMTCAMNLPVFYDTLILPEQRDDQRFQFYAILQKGFSTIAFDEYECCASNVLRIWNKDQNAIKMLEGFRSDTNIGQLRTRIDANDDGIRGHFCVCGDLDVDFAGELGLEYRFYDEFFLSAHLPIFSMELKCVSWKDLTQEVNVDDFRVKEYLTNDLARRVRELGCLDICGWKRSGVGDLLLLTGWRRDFEQSKKMLKNVRLSTRVGLTLPTGKEANEDEIFAFAYGNDGGVGALVGGSLDLVFGQYLKAGLDVQLLHVFGHEKCRRIKTHRCQTELLLLKKMDTYREYGLTQRFNLYVQLYRFIKGLSCKVGYQFRRKSEDMIYICSHEFSDHIANTAISLQDWTMHSLVCNISYDFWNENDDRCVHPYISLFVKLPFNGMNTAMVRTVGCTLGIDF